MLGMTFIIDSGKMLYMVDNLEFFNEAYVRWDAY